MHVSDVWHHQAGFVGEEGHQNGEFFLLNHIKAIGFLGHFMLSLVGFFSGYLMQQQFQQTMGVMGLTDDHFLADRMFEVLGGSRMVESSKGHLSRSQHEAVYSTRKFYMEAENGPFKLKIPF